MSVGLDMCVFFFFSSRRRHTRYIGDWSSDVCSSDLLGAAGRRVAHEPEEADAPDQDGDEGEGIDDALERDRKSVV